MARDPNLDSFDDCSNTNVTVGSSATQIVAAYTKRARSVLITNNHASDVLYVGYGSGVTTSNGTPVPAAGSVTLTGKTAIYGIRGGSNDISVRVIVEQFA